MGGIAPIEEEMNYPVAAQLGVKYKPEKSPFPLLVTVGT
jgi:hypothetical protein